MTALPAARTAKVVHLEEHGPELRAIMARTRLRMYAQLAWSAQVREHDRERWRDSWEDVAARQRWRTEDARGHELGQNLAAVEAGLRGARLGERIAGLFGLRDAEVDLLHACLALALDPDLGEVVATLTGRPVLTEPFVRALFERGPKRILRPESRLARWELVRTVELAAGEPDGVAIDPAIADWFTGVYAVEAELVSLGRAVRAAPPLEQWPLDELEQRVLARGARATRIVLVGPAGCGRRTLAAALAERLRLRLFAIDSDATDDASWPRAVRRAHRQALLSEAAFAVLGDAQSRRPSPPMPGGAPLTFAILEAGQAVPPLADALDLVVDVPAATLADRTRLWQVALPAWAASEHTELARAYRTTPGDIAYVAARMPATRRDAIAALHERSRGMLGELAQRLECPFRWTDLVLPDATHAVLRDFAYEARERGRVWDEPAIRRLFPQGRGLIALWTGSPGTGKTMAAQAVAAELGLELFRISLSDVVSKYVGETAKNLQRVLARADRMDAILFFDEADALFGKRTEIKDAHDRYANTETNHLLQAIESYAGIAVLASNKKANVDAAFVRRLRYVVEFPRPDAQQRRILWTQLAGELCGIALDRDHPRSLAALASCVEATGAQIKLSALTAVFAARREGVPVAPRHLAYGLDRELLKEGRSLSEQEREQIARA